MYNHVTLKGVTDIVCEHLKEHRPVRSLMETPKRKVSVSSPDKTNEEKDGNS